MRDAARQSRAEAARRLGRVSGGFAALLAATFALIVLGALVRAHEAGLACPDWPLCFGRVIPAMNLEVAFEWSHRVLAGSVALGFATLACMAFAQPEARARVGRWLALGAALLVCQILLGALTVWQLLASWTVTLHLLTGNAFAVILLLVATRLRPAPDGPHELPTPIARALVSVAAVALLVQMAIGGLVASSYAGLACPEWPTCNGGSWYPSLRGSVGLHLVHRTQGYLLVVILGATAWLTRRPRRLARAVTAAFLLSLVQVAVGVANVLFGLPVEVTGLHSALAAGLVLTLAFAVDQAWSRDDSRQRAALPGSVAEAH